MIHGNCQAESLRIAVDGPDLGTVRIPPVHELVRADLPQLGRVLADAAVFITQPVRDGYHGLALGHRELTAGLDQPIRVLRVPVIRFAGLYPTQAIVRPPSDPSVVPPLVPYHDLTVLAEAAGLPGRSEPSPKTVRAIGDLSLAELRRREHHHATIIVSDLFAGSPHFGQMRTINHPGNPIWEALADRVREQLGLDAPIPLTRPLLDAVHAPRAAAVIDAYGLTDAPDPDWQVAGRRIPPETVRAAHLAWYRERPDAVTEGLRRHAPVLELLAHGARP